MVGVFMSVKEDKLILKGLSKMTPDDILVDNDELMKMIDDTNKNIKKQKKCKLCNKKYNANNRMYGNGCLNNLYRLTGIEKFKGIDDDELYLYNAVLIKLGKTNCGEKVGYFCESYFSMKLFDNLKFIKSDIINNEIKWCIENNRKPIMKLNTAYRVTNILKRNKKKLTIFSDDAKDKLIDKATLKFFNYYFKKLKSVDKDDYEVYYYIQFLFWKLVVIGGLLVQFKLSSKLLSHSVTVIDDEASTLLINDYTNDDDIIKTLKNDTGLKEKIKIILNKYGKDNIIDINSKTVNNSSDCNYTFTGGDLSFSLHTVFIAIIGEKYNNLWNLNITITDRYDFTEILSDDVITKNNKKILNIAATLNDLAAISSEYGVIKPYDVIINFKWDNFKC